MLRMLYISGGNISPSKSAEVSSASRMWMEGTARGEEEGMLFMVEMR
jgi:hypothetical protein